MTQDLDVWTEPTRENAERVCKTLARFGAPAESLGITRDDLIAPNCVIQFGVPPNRIDLMTSISGVPSFGDASEARM